MILDLPIWIVIGVFVVAANWMGIHPDWTDYRLQSPPPWLQWVLWLYVVALCLGYMSIGLIILSFVF